jgi:hypothetical protein
MTECISPLNNNVVHIKASHNLVAKGKKSKAISVTGRGGP